MIQGGNDTKVTVGLMAGAACTILWWVLKTWAGVTPDPEVVSASVMLLTGVAQYMLPIGGGDE